MRIDDRLVKMNQEKNRKRRQQMQEDEDEETLTYATRPKMVNINKNKGAFPDAFDGINTRESIFDRMATFRTDNP